VGPSLPPTLVIQGEKDKIVLTRDAEAFCSTGCARLGAYESTVSRILGHKAIAGTIALSGICAR
jgi:hypothetical protein